MRQLTLDKLTELGLKGMVGALEAQVKMGDNPFEDRLPMLLDAEELYRKDRSLEWRLKGAGLRLKACLEELDLRGFRTLDRTQLTTLATCKWVKEKRSLIVSGPTVIGKTFLACASKKSLRGTLLGKALPNVQAPLGTSCCQRARNA